MLNSQTNNFPIYNASQIRVGIVCAQFNSDLTDKMLQSAQKKLQEYQIAKKNIEVFKVAGCVEIPVILKATAKSKKFDILIAIGAIIKGETDHYDFVAKVVVDGILQVMNDEIIPIGFAVLTLPNKNLAQDRLSIGAEAVVASMQNALLLKNISLPLNKGEVGRG